METTMDWVTAHETLVGFAKRRAELDSAECTALLHALRTQVHRHLGYASFAEYVERLFGYGPRTTEDKLRTASALESLPDLQRSLRDGELSWSGVRELARVATPATEYEWLGAARGKTVRQIEQLVSGRKTGDRPSDPASPGAKRHILRFDVSAETYATFREAVAHLRRQNEERLDDDTLLLQLSREILRGPADEGRSSYQIAVTTCDRCAGAFQEGAGAVVELEPEVVAMAECDAQRVGERRDSAHVGATRASQDVPPATRRHVMRRDHGRCVVPGCSHGTFVDLHHLLARSEGGAHDEDNLIVLCAAHHRAVHRGSLIVEGRVSAGIHFRSADGTSYGELPLARGVAAREKALGALCALGFGGKESRNALNRVARGTMQEDVAAPEPWVRAALALLVPAPAKRCHVSSQSPAA